MVIIFLKAKWYESVGDEETLIDLQRETRRCLRLTHPNIVRVYDFAYRGNYAAIVMEFIDGQTLYQRKLEQPKLCLQPSEIRNWIGPLIDALEYAHNQPGVVHRDLKPSNILIDRSGIVRIADFGVARSLNDANARLTRDRRTTGGTLLYMGPQQLCGEVPSTADDIYSLGVTLYELLTGKPPFYQGDISHQIKSVDAPLASNRRRELLGTEVDKGLERIPKYWDEVISACLSKEIVFRPTLTSLSQVLRSLSDESSILTAEHPINIWRADLAEKAYSAGLEHDDKCGGGVSRQLTLRYYQKAAELGHTDAQEELGRAYGRGEGLPQDPVKAAYWYSKAAEGGTAADKFLLAVRFEDGDEVEKDAALAVRWYRESAECGDRDAQFSMGCAYEYGEGVAQDDVASFQWYHKAAQQGHEFSEYKIGKAYWYGKGVAADEVMAVSWYRKAAEKGDLIAQTQLGQAYIDGRGVDQDLKQGLSWLMQAADKNHTSAQTTIAVAYRVGKGVEADYAKAFFWYRKAADLGSAYAQYSLGCMYENGEGVPADEVAAFEWYNKAAEQGDESAQVSLGEAYEDGKGVQKDSLKAFLWYQKASTENHAHAQYKVGQFLQQGHGIDQNQLQAFQYYLKSAHQDYGPAMTKVALAYSSGIGVEKNAELAGQWSLKAEANPYNQFIKSSEKIMQVMIEQEKAERENAEGMPLSNPQ
jgi:TPR repeat protein